MLQILVRLDLIVAFFVGASVTDAFIDDSFAANDDNNGNNGCENANPNAKACENNPNTTLTCADCAAALFDGYDACRTLPVGEQNACFHAVGDAYFVCASETEGGSCPAPPPPDF